MSWTLKSFVLSVAFGLVVFSAALAGGERGYCEAEVKGQWTQHGIIAADIARIVYDRQTRSIGGDERTVGVNAWINLKSCAGSVVVDMDTTCRVRQVYTRGDCRVEGLKHF